ncbi:MAG: GWxTD domain-containing protein [Ignavibacteriaceae bacterium]
MRKVIAYILFPIAILFSQITDEKKIELYIDYAQFRGDDGRTLLEVYYSFSRNALEHYQTDDGFEGKYTIVLKVFKQDSLLNKIDWIGIDVADSREEILTGQTINDLRTLLLMPYTYKMEFNITDLNNNETKSILKEIEVKEYNKSEFDASEIQLSTKITKSTNQSRFIKNTYQIVPNPSSVFDMNNPILFYYLELYNLPLSDDSADSIYQVIVSITDANNRVVKTLPTKNYRKENESVVKVGNIYVGALFSGVYYLDVKIIDPLEGISISRTKRFYIFRHIDQLVVHSDDNKGENIELSEYAVMSEEELDQEFNYASYITTSDEVELFESLNLPGKREFMFKFWKARKNYGKDFKKNYFERIEFANKRYSVGNKKGWETHPGRVILVYGIPDEIDKETSATSMKNYEVWTYYELEGGSQFVFVNTYGYGELQLVHSTARNEIQDYDWQARYLN